MAVSWLSLLMASLLIGCNCIGSGDVSVSWDAEIDPFPTEGSVIYGGIAYQMLCDNNSCSFNFGWDEDTSGIPASEVESVRLRIDGIEDVLEFSDGQYEEQEKCSTGDSLAFTWPLED